MKEESTVYGNYNLIFDKVIKDNYMDEFYSCLESVFNKEVNFAMSELYKMKKSDSSLNIKHLLEINMYIFKENLKIIF